MRALPPSLVALLACACGPKAGDPCDPVDDGAVCAGHDVLVCVCPAPDVDGACPAGDATWQVDELCSCDFNSMTCA